MQSAFRNSCWLRWLILFIGLTVFLPFTTWLGCVFSRTAFSWAQLFNWGMLIGLIVSSLVGAWGLGIYYRVAARRG